MSILGLVTLKKVELLYSYLVINMKILKLLYTFHVSKARSNMIFEYMRFELVPCGFYAYTNMFV